MKHINKALMNWGLWTVPVTLALLLIIVAQYNFLSFHAFAELFAVVISFIIFTFVWSTHPFSRNYFLLFMACGYFWVGSLDVMHTLTFEGMDVISVERDHLGVQFWIVGRYLEAFILLAAPFMSTRPFNQNLQFSIFGGIAIGFTILILLGYFPEGFIPGKGLTDFKVYSEYLIIMILVLAIISLHYYGRKLSTEERTLITASIVLTICAELAFTFYVKVYGISNLTGHIFKIFSYWLIFQAVFISNLRKPFTMLKTSEERYSKSLSFAKIGTWDSDFGTGELHWSNHISVLFGGKEGSLVTSSENFHKAVHPNDRQNVIDALNNCINNNVGYDIEHRVIWPDGSVHWLHERGGIIRSDDGTPLNMLGVVHDITRRKIAEEELIRSKELLEDRVKIRTQELQATKDAAEDANNAKSKFLSTMSHELRTPLNAIIGFSDMINHQIHGPVIPSRYQVYAKDINESGNHLLTLINKVLDMSKIEAGEYDVFIENFDTVEVINEVMSMMRGRASDQQIILGTELPEAGLQSRADRIITKQILINLLSNAIKFTPENGSVIVRMACVDEKIIIDVIDTGIGMSAEDMKRALEPFVQIEREKGRFHEGTGLGLPLCNHFAELQGGGFSIQSVLGKGTTSTFSLPLHDIVDIKPLDDSDKSSISPPVWLPSMSIGINKWDSDHKTLLDLIVSLQNSLIQNEVNEDNADIVGTLAQYINIHLASEEFIMKQLDYPDFSKHKAKHDEFRDWMKNIKNEFINSTDKTYKTMLADALQEWWYNHILKDDMAYKIYFYPLRKEVDDLLSDYKGIEFAHSKPSSPPRPHDE